LFKPLSPRNKIAEYLIHPAVFVLKLLQVVVQQNPQVIFDRLASTQGGGFEGVLVGLAFFVGGLV
jgi:hypothetical protein